MHKHMLTEKIYNKQYIYTAHSYQYVYYKWNKWKKSSLIVEIKSDIPVANVESSRILIRYKLKKFEYIMWK